MGVSIYIKNNDECNSIVSLAGQSEVDKLWMPIVQRAGLQFFDLCFSAGLAVDQANYPNVLNEALVLLKGIEEIVEFLPDVGNPVFRCRRLVNLLTENPPDQHRQIYVVDFDVANIAGPYVKS